MLWVKFGETTASEGVRQPNILKVSIATGSVEVDERKALFNMATWTDEIIKQVKEMRAAGLSFGQIAQQLNLPKGSVWSIYQIGKDSNTSMKKGPVPKCPSCHRTSDVQYRPDEEVKWFCGVCRLGFMPPKVERPVKIQKEDSKSNTVLEPTPVEPAEDNQVETFDPKVASKSSLKDELFAEYENLGKMLKLYQYAEQLFGPEKATVLIAKSRELLQRGPAA